MLFIACLLNTQVEKKTAPQFYDAGQNGMSWAVGMWMDSRIGYYVSLRGHGLCHRGLDNLCMQEAEDGGGRFDRKKDHNPSLRF